jgi:2-keto-3-deoxy-6-phosphogluconate aldolase
MPVFCGIGGGLTQGKRVVNMAHHAENQGALGVVMNSPSTNEDLEHVAAAIDIPIIITVVSDKEDIASRVKAGAQIINVSAASKTPQVVKAIREQFPELPIIATGGNSPESILRTIEAGANAITWTPPSNGEIFHDKMDSYRQKF